MIRSWAVLVAALLAWAVAGPATGQKLDPASQDALDKTLQILLDPQARSGELTKSSQGSAMDQQVRALTGSDALTQELYQIAGEVLKELAQSTARSLGEDIGHETIGRYTGGAGGLPSPDHPESHSPGPLWPATRS